MPSSFCYVCESPSKILNRLQSLAVLLHPLCTSSPPPAFTILLLPNWAQISWLHQPAAAQLGTKTFVVVVVVVVVFFASFLISSSALYVDCIS